MYFLPRNQRMSLPLFRMNSDELLQSLRTQDAAHWQRLGEERALSVFHEAAEQVPAYKDFLKKNGVKHHKIVSIEDFFQGVPLTDKKTYIETYERKDLQWQNKQQGAVVYSSSGTTGKPTYWLRFADHDQEAVAFHEFILKQFFHIEKYKTLFLDCFAMGIHVAGFITATSIQHLAGKYPNILLATPGSKKEDVINTLLAWQGDVDQIVFIGYPPLIKDIVHESTATGVDWRKTRKGFLFAAQGFSEKWRSYLHELVSGDEETPIINLYGSADAGAMAFETPYTIGVRRNIENGMSTFPGQLNNLSDSVPYLFQYIPTQKYFESFQNELLVTSDNGIPLLRYNIHDIGGILAPSEIQSGIQTEFQLPCVYLYGRSNYTAVFYGANIYPEHVQNSIEYTTLFDRVTGRFVMEVAEDETLQQGFHVHVEVKQGLALGAEEQKSIWEDITNHLCKINREFLVVFREMKNEMNVHVHLHEYGSPLFVSKKMKHTYLKKS